MDPFTDANANAYGDTAADQYTYSDVYAHAAPTVQVERR